MWWGHPSTTGIPHNEDVSIDFFLSLDTEVLDANTQYSEQLVRMEFMNTAPFEKVHFLII